VLPGSSASVLRPTLAIEHELAAISADPKMIRRQPNQQHHCHFALDFERKESVCGDFRLSPCSREWPATRWSSTRMATWTGINIFRIKCGRIIEVWSEVDAVSRGQQLTGTTSADSAR
jgi:hypothetical protein